MVWRRPGHATSSRMPAALVLSIITFASFFHCSGSAVAAAQDKPSPRATPPHIIYILADDLGWNDVGWMNKGNENIIQTPNLDQLAAERVILKSLYTQSVCTPTRASLLTGKYTIHLGLQHSIVQSGHPSALGTEHRTLAEELKERNYVTHMVGKWHLGYYQKKFQPLQRGFNTFKGMLTGAEYYFSHVARCEFPYYDFKGSTSGWGLDWFEGEEAAWEDEERYSTDLLTKRAEETILSHRSSSGSSGSTVEGEVERPLFLYLPYQAVHGRLQAPEEDVARFAHIKGILKVGIGGSMRQWCGSLTKGWGM